MTLSGPGAIGETTGHPARYENGEHGARRGRNRAADQSELGHVLGRKTDLVAEEADGVRTDCRAHRRVDLGEALADDLEHLGRRYAPPADKAELEAAALHLLRDLRAGAVDDAHLIARSAQIRDRLGDAAGGGAAHFQHDDAHVRYSALMRT